MQQKLLFVRNVRFPMVQLYCRLSVLSSAVLSLCVCSAAHAQSQTAQYAQIARFKAASVILDRVVSDVAGFKYPGVNTSDIPELMSPYTTMLVEATESLRRNISLSQRQLAELAFFCGTGIMNSKNLILREMRGLLLPQNPGDTPDRLRAAHAPAVAFFSEQSAVLEILPSVLDCQRAER
jgi:hypothetical protein